MQVIDAMLLHNSLKHAQQPLLHALSLLHCQSPCPVRPAIFSSATCHP